MMDLGVALDMGRHDGDLGSLIEDFQPLLAGLTDWRYHSVWVGEAYPTGPADTGHVGSPLTILAAFSRMTSARLGVAVLLLPAWSLLRLAYDAAVLDQMSAGRLILGVGVGRAPLWSRFGVGADDVATFVDEMLAGLRGLWGGDAGFTGRVVSAEHGIDPLPRQPGGPPIWVGGTSARAPRRAAHLGDAWTAGSSTSMTEVAKLVEAYRHCLANAGKDPASAVVGVNRVAVVAETTKRAREDAEQHAAAWWEGYRRRGLSDIDDFDSVFEQLMLVGNPDQVTARLEEYRRIGVTHVNLRVAPGATPIEMAIRTLELLAPASRALA